MPLTHAFVIAFGLVMGSFFNVCIHRIPQRKSIVRPGSRCPHCHHALSFWENIPIVSYLLLRGRCRRCHTSISWVYPTVEAATALLLYLLFLKYGLGPPFWVNAIFFGLLIVLVFIDLFERLLPNVLTLTGMSLGFLLSPFQSAEFFRESNLSGSGEFWVYYAASIMGIVVGGGFLWAVAEVYRRVKKIEGMGFGDIKMMAMVGAFLGWRYAWLTILVGSLLGALLGGGYMYLLAKGRRYELPFGSFLGIGAMISTLWGRELLFWYFRQF